MVVGPRAFRLPRGESVVTKLNRVEALLSQLKDDRQPSSKAVTEGLIEYHELLKWLWLWGQKKK